MTYLPVGLLKSGAYTAPTLTKTSPTVTHSCPEMQQWSESLQKCVRTCPEGQAFDPQTETCKRVFRPCTGPDEIPGAQFPGGCFRPTEQPIPWDDPSHPFWSMELQSPDEAPYELSWRRGEVYKDADGQQRWKGAASVCDKVWMDNYLDQLAAGKKLRKDVARVRLSRSYVGDPTRYPGLERGMYYCRAQPSPESATPGREAVSLPLPPEERDWANAACRMADSAACWTGICQNMATYQGLIDPRYVGACAAWLLANPDKRGGDFVTYVKSLSDEERLLLEQQVQAQAQAQAAAAAAGKTSSLLLYLAIGGAALAVGITLLNKRRSQ